MSVMSYRSVYDTKWDSLPAFVIQRSMSRGAENNLAHLALGHKTFAINDYDHPITLHHSSLMSLMVRGLLKRVDERWIVTAKGLEVAQLVRGTK